MKSRKCCIFLVLLSLLCSQGCAQRKISKPVSITTDSVKTTKTTQLLSTKELLKGSNPFKKICIIPFKNFSLNPRAAEETTDIVLTELYFSNIFDEIVENKESKQEMEKLSSIKLLMNKELVISIGKKLDIDGFLFGVVNQDNKDGKGSFDVSFSLIDAASGENVWSVNIRESQTNSGMSTRFLFMKSVLKKVLADFRRQVPSIKRKVIVKRQSPPPKSYSTNSMPSYNENKTANTYYNETPAINKKTVLNNPNKSFSRTYQGEPLENNIYAPVKISNQSQNTELLAKKKPVEIPVQKNFSYGETPYLKQRGHQRSPTIEKRNKKTGPVHAPVFKYLRRKRVKSATISDY